MDLNELKYESSYIRAIEIISTNEIENISISSSVANNYIYSNKPLVLIENNSISKNILKTNIVDMSLIIKLGKPLHNIRNTPELYFSINQISKLYLIIYSSENKSIFINNNDCIMYYSNFFNTNNMSNNIVEFNKSFDIIDFKTTSDIYFIKEKIGKLEYVFSTIVFSLEVQENNNNNEDINFLKQNLEGSTVIIDITYYDVNNKLIKNIYTYTINNFKLNNWNFIEIKFIKIKKTEFKFKLNIDNNNNNNNNNTQKLPDINKMIYKYLTFNLNIILYDYESVDFSNVDANNPYNTFNGDIYNNFNIDENNTDNIISNKYNDKKFKTASDSNDFYYFKNYHKNKLLNFYYPVKFDNLHYICNEIEINLYINNISGFKKVNIAFDNYSLLPVQRNFLDNKFITIDNQIKNLSAILSIKKEFIDKFNNNFNIVYVLITISLDNLESINNNNNNINNINNTSEDLHAQYGYFIITLTSMPNYVKPYFNNKLHPYFAINTYLSSQTYLKINIDTKNLYRLFLTLEINNYDYN